MLKQVNQASYPAPPFMNNCLKTVLCIIHFSFNAQNVKKKQSDTFLRMQNPRDSVYVYGALIGEKKLHLFSLLWSVEMEQSRSICGIPALLGLSNYLKSHSQAAALPNLINI